MNVSLIVIIRLQLTSQETDAINKKEKMNKEMWFAEANAVAKKAFHEPCLKTHAWRSGSWWERFHSLAQPTFPFPSLGVSSYCSGGSFIKNGHMNAIRHQEQYAHTEKERRGKFSEVSSKKEKRKKKSVIKCVLKHDHNRLFFSFSFFKGAHQTFLHFL